MLLLDFLCSEFGRDSAQPRRMGATQSWFVGHDVQYNPSRCTIFKSSKPSIYGFLLYMLKQWSHFILIGNDFNWNNLSIKLQAGVDL